VMAKRYEGLYIPRATVTSGIVSVT